MHACRFAFHGWNLAKGHSFLGTMQHVAAMYMRMAAAAAPPAGQLVVHVANLGSGPPPLAELLERATTAGLAAAAPGGVRVVARYVHVDALPYSMAGAEMMNELARQIGLEPGAVLPRVHQGHNVLPTSRSADTRRQCGLTQGSQDIVSLHSVVEFDEAGQEGHPDAAAVAEGLAYIAAAGAHVCCGGTAPAVHRTILNIGRVLLRRFNYTLLLLSVMVRGDEPRDPWHPKGKAVSWVLRAPLPGVPSSTDVAGIEWLGREAAKLPPRHFRSAMGDASAVYG